MASREKVVATNSRAHHEYFIEERFKAGISLLGTEVKALREGRANLRESFARVDGEEVFLHRCYIGPYSHGNIQNHEPFRTRKLLLHRREIRKLLGLTRQRGYALIPLKLYFVESWIKVELALAKGKKTHDKREAIRKKEDIREIARALKARGQS